MTDSEYKEFAKHLVEDLFKEEENNKNESAQPIPPITHVGEVFMIKIIEAAHLLDKSTFPHNSAGKLSKMIIRTLNLKENDESDNSGSIPPNPCSVGVTNVCLFWGIQYAVKSHTDPEYMLKNLGVDNPNEIISMVNDTENIDDIEDFINSFFEIIKNLQSTLGRDKFSSLCIWGVVCYAGVSIIEVIKRFFNVDINVLEFCKGIKELGEKYSSICNERFSSMFFNLRSLFDKDTFNEEYIMDYILPFIKIKKYHPVGSDISVQEFKKFARNYSYQLLDSFFLFYFCIYKNPQYIVNLGFILMSNSISHEIAKAMFSTFRKDDYAALIQYEYEWWRKETGNSLSLPFPFYEKIINLNELGVIDYELAGSDIADGRQLPDPHLCPLPKNSESNNNSEEMIFNSLKDNLLNMREEDRYKAGASFRSKYLTKVIDTACNLKDRYSVYGFAWILFNSKYFNWKGREFNQEFVMDIANIFNIDGRLLEGKGYNQSKSREKAKQMLSKNEMSYLNMLMKE